MSILAILQTFAAVVQKSGTLLQNSLQQNSLLQNSSSRGRILRTHKKGPPNDGNSRCTGFDRGSYARFMKEKQPGGLQAQKCF